ncbi:solute carrier family 35 member F3-like isoform X1 [Styela clava]
MKKNGESRYVVQQNLNDAIQVQPENYSPIVNESLMEEPFDNQNCREKRKKILVGCIIVILLAISWVGAQQFAQNAIQLASFDAPYFMTWFGTSWMTLCFPIYCICIALKYRNRQKIIEVIKESEKVFETSKITTKQFFLRIVPMNILWVATNYLYMIALKFIAATDASAIFASNVAFVYMLSLCILKEKLYVIRILACIFCISGVVLFGYAAGFAGGSNLLIGALMAIATALGAALYKVIFKVWVGAATLGQVSLFLTYLGISNIFLMWTIFITLYFTNVEHFTGDNIPWNPLIASSFLGLVFNYVLSFGVAYTYPLFISIALMLGVPLNAVVDVAVRGVTFNATRVLAASLVLLGFAIMLLPDHFNNPIHDVFLCKFPRKRNVSKNNIPKNSDEVDSQNKPLIDNDT